MYASTDVQLEEEYYVKIEDTRIQIDFGTLTRRFKLDFGCKVHGIITGLPSITKWKDQYLTSFPILSLQPGPWLLNRIEESGYPCLAPDLTKSSFTNHP